MKPETAKLESIPARSQTERVSPLEESQSGPATNDAWGTSRLGFRKVEHILNQRLRQDRLKKADAKAKRKNAGAEHDELYNLKSDPAESKNVIAENAELAAKMKRRLAQARQAGYTRPSASN